MAGKTCLAAGMLPKGGRRQVVERTLEAEGRIHVSETSLVSGAVGRLKAGS